MEHNSNPFITIGYKGPHLFCNRSSEKRQLTDLMRNGVNVTLFSIRRMGKSGLIHHVFYPFRKSKSIACIYVDILSTTNLTEFTNLIATAVYNHFPPKHGIGQRIMTLFQSLRPTISFDALSGTPSLSLVMSTDLQKEQTIGQIFQFLDQQNIQVVFAIDEFQQILNYPETNIEAILRTYIQQLQHTSFIFSGSNQNMMQEIFNSAKRPFFASCTNLNLDYIKQKDYAIFIQKQFSLAQRKIDSDGIQFILDFTLTHTYYTQYFCHTLFSTTHISYSLEDIKQNAITILKSNENTYFQYKNLLTQFQWQLLIAIAIEQKLEKPQSKKFISTHHLGTPSLVKRGLEALLNKEIIFKNSGVEKPYYEVYDKFFMRWMQRNYSN